MVLEVVREAEVEGHVCGQDGTDDQLPDFLHTQTHRQCYTCQPGSVFCVSLHVYNSLLFDSVKLAE